MLFLSGNDIKRIFTMRDAIEADKDAFIMQARKECITPLRTNFDIELGSGQSLFMPAHIKGLNATGLKIVSVFPNNASKGKPVVPATMILLDDETGVVEAIMDGTELTRLRTGALTGAATEILANKDARIGTLFGTGGQAAAQLEAMLEARALEEVRIYDIDPDRIAAFIEEQKKSAESKGARLTQSGSPEDAIDGADVITTVTTSARPVFPGNLVKPGTHINGIGAYTPEMAELDPQLLVRADGLFIDNKEAVFSEAGDFIQPLNSGILKESKISGELGEVLEGSIPGRKSESDITVFKSVGFAALDVIAAQRIVLSAKEEGIGTLLDS